MTKPKHLLLVSGVCFVFTAVAFFVLLDVNGLAQEDTAAISITPPIWLESKFVKWDENEHWYDYFVEGWWFTEDEENGYWHVGQWRTFEVTADVADSVLVLDAQGRMTQRLCRLGFIDRSTIAELVTCVNGTQAFLPVVWQER